MRSNHAGSNDRTNRYLRDLKYPALFLTPLILILSLFILLPVLGTILNGFFRDITFLPKKWIGLDNYLRLFADPGFRQSFVFTILFIAVSVPAEIILGLGIAALLHTPSKIRLFLRATILIPWAVPSAVSARVWELIYNYNYGLFNTLLALCFRDGAPVNWLGSPVSAFIALVIADIWKTTPFAAIILLAGLSALPENLYRQASIDGANFMQIFFRITLPVLRPIIVVTFLFRTIDALRVFDLMYVLTSGGPGGSTTSLSLFGYKYFAGGDFGYGSAVSVLLFICAFLLSVVYVRSTRYQEDVA